MSKMFVLDTNVLLADPDALFAFEEHHITIPITVIEELDTFKSSSGELGRNARKVSRTLERLIGDLDPTWGIPLGDGRGSLWIETANVAYKYVNLASTPDNYILGTTQKINEDFRRKSGSLVFAEVILVSKDTNLRVKAKALGIKANDYQRLKQEAGAIGKIREVHIATDAAFERLAFSEYVDVASIHEESEAKRNSPAINDALICMAPNGLRSVLARVRGKGLYQIANKIKPCGIKPRNAEQRFFVDMLIDPAIDLVVCNGVAGTGKTLISVASGIAAVEGGQYHSLMITKAIMPVGKDIGYLKGDKEEKIIEWLAPFYDNLDYISFNKEQGWLDRMFKDGKIEIDALTYIRGRSLMHKFVIIDEVQNLTAIQVKTIITRIADGSKLVLLGDLQQIDNPYVDARDNGLAYAMGRMVGLDNVAVLSMAKSERGRLASQAILRL